MAAQLKYRTKAIMVGLLIFGSLSLIGYFIDVYSASDNTLSFSLQQQTANTHNNSVTELPINLSLAQQAIQSFHAQHFYDNAIDIPVPALMIGGPPKTGTNTFMQVFALFPDTFGFPREHFFWAGMKPGNRCSPMLSTAQWTHYLSQYTANQTNLSSLIPMIYSTNRVSKNKCTVQAFMHSYERRHSIQCVNPLHSRRNIENLSQTRAESEYTKYCWFFEKTPSYARSPFVPIWISNLLPNTKYLTILRNPITHVWSAYHHFGGGKRFAPGQQRLKEERVIAFFKRVSSIDYLNGICDNIYEMYLSLNGKDRFLQIKNEFKKLIIAYFERRYVSPKDIEIDYKLQKGGKIVWSAYYLPILLIGLFANEEQWTLHNYRWIQFEYLWSETLDSLRLIRCWMTQGLRINNDECEFERDDLVNRYLAFNLSHKSAKEKNSKAKSRNFTQWYSNEVVSIFGACNNVLEHILIKDRSDVLIGQWTKWKYFA